MPCEGRDRARRSQPCNSTAPRPPSPLPPCSPAQQAAPVLAAVGGVVQAVGRRLIDARHTHAVSGGPALRRHEAGRGPCPLLCACRAGSASLALPLCSQRAPLLLPSCFFSFPPAPRVCAAARSTAAACCSSTRYCWTPHRQTWPSPCRQGRGGWRMVRRHGQWRRRLPRLGEVAAAGAPLGRGLTLSAHSPHLQLITASPGAAPALHVFLQGNERAGPARLCLCLPLLLWRGVQGVQCEAHARSPADPAASCRPAPAAGQGPHGADGCPGAVGVRVQRGGDPR